MSRKFIRIISKDCRSDDIKTWYGVHSPRNRKIRLYQKGKTKMILRRSISDLILETRAFSTGTSVYEIKEDDDVVRWLNL